MSTVLEPPPEVRLPDHYDVVNGRVVGFPPMSGYASEVANRVRDELTYFGKTTGRGRTRNDMLFRLPLPEDQDRKREPDAAFITYERWPINRTMPYRGNPVDVVPDLVLEVASPTDAAEELHEKVKDYLRAGVRLAWLVYPRLRYLYAYSQVDSPPRFYRESDTLDGGETLPGFSVPMANLFPTLIEPSDAVADE